ncbi:MAG: hypothetical protein PHR39_09645 [Actinomycetota bacterium]|nr:hypothetical protein [Actinomycetota bacterium]
MIYSFFGVGIEIIFTSIHDYIRYKDIALKGRSYLWMFLIYGCFGLIIKPLYPLISFIPFVIRGLIYTAIIFVGEFAYGFLLKLIIKKVPWEYKTRWSILGIVNLAYLPFWLLLSYILELIYRCFLKITIF